MESLVNNFSTYLAGDITPSDAVVYVASVAGLPVSGSFRAQINTEILLVSQVSGSYLLVSRAQEGTLAVSAASGSLITFPITKAGFMSSLDNLVAEVGLGSADTGKSKLWYPSDAPNIRTRVTSYAPLGLTAPMYEPDLTGWAWNNQGTATLSTAGGVVTMWKPNTAGENCSIYDHPIPAPPYTVTCLAAFRSYVADNPIGLPIAFRDSATGRLEEFNIVVYITFSPNALGISVRRHNNTTSYDSTIYKYTAKPVQYMWYRVRDDGTNFYYSFGFDGVNFVGLGQHARNAWLANPDRVGFGVNPLQNTYWVQLDILSWKETPG